MALFGPISVVPWSLLVGILEGSPLAITDGVWIRIDSGDQPQALPHITDEHEATPPYTLFKICIYIYIYMEG
jgi:hypothetical protein